MLRDFILFTILFLTLTLAAIQLYSFNIRLAGLESVAGQTLTYLNNSYALLEKTVRYNGEVRKYNKEIEAKENQKKSLQVIQ